MNGFDGNKTSPAFSVLNCLEMLAAWKHFKALASLSIPHLTASVFKPLREFKICETKGVVFQFHQSIEWHYSFL